MTACELRPNFGHQQAALLIVKRAQGAPDRLMRPSPPPSQQPSEPRTGPWCRGTPEVKMQDLPSHHDFELLRTIFQQHESCEFVPPEFLPAVETASREEDRSRYVGRCQKRLAG